MASSWGIAARLLASTDLSATDIARVAKVTENQLKLWQANANFRQLIEECEMREGSSKYGGDVKHKVAKWLATTDLNQRDVAFLTGVPQKQVSRWWCEPEFKQLVAEYRQKANAVRDLVEDDDDGGEWSPVITFYSKKSGGK